MTLRCVEDSFHIDAVNEWGYSDASIWTVGNLTVGVFQDAGYQVKTTGLWSRHLDGAPPSKAPDFFMTDVPTPSSMYNQTDTPYAKGQEPDFGIVSTGVCAADQPVLLHVGVEHAVSMVLNDVSANTSARGNWIVDFISIGRDPNA